MKAPGCRGSRHIRLAAYCAAAIAGTYFAAASAAEIQGRVNKGGGAFRSYEINGAPLLDSFYFRFTDSERNIQTIQVEPASPISNPCFECAPVPPGQIFFEFQDETADDPYDYRISHAELPVPILRHRISDYCRATCKATLDSHERGAVFVMVGFTFTYVGRRDHHIQRVGMWEQDGVLEVHYRDENDDNLFRYDLEYVWLPRSLIPVTGHVDGVEAQGSASATINPGPVAAGPTVLRGFDFFFRPELDWGVDWGALVRLPIVTPPPGSDPGKI